MTHRTAWLLGRSERKRRKRLTARQRMQERWRGLRGSWMAEWENVALAPRWASRAAAVLARGMMQGLGASDQADAIAYAFSGEPYGRSPAEAVMGDARALKIADGWTEEAIRRSYRKMND